jgi:hypothetical protein
LMRRCQAAIAAGNFKAYAMGASAGWDNVFQET